jgi:hypothetical protein
MPAGQCCRTTERRCPGTLPAADGQEVVAGVEDERSAAAGLAGLDASGAGVAAQLVDDTREAVDAAVVRAPVAVVVGARAEQRRLTVVVVQDRQGECRRVGGGALGSVGAGGGGRRGEQGRRERRDEYPAERAAPAGPGGP